MASKYFISLCSVYKARALFWPIKVFTELMFETLRSAKWSGVGIVRGGILSRSDSVNFLAELFIFWLGRTTVV